MVKRKREYVPNFTGVSSSLARHLISTEGEGGNLVFSPLSIHVVLGLITAGSGGPTRDQLLAYFKSNSAEELNKLLSHHATRVLTDGGPLGGPRLSAANGVWVDRSLTLKSDFKGIVENDYKAACKRVDFQTKADKVRKKVNTWADEETNGLIKDLLPSDSVDCRTRLIFANAIYFKGAWEYKFDSSRTKDYKFFLMNGTKVKVPFMTSYRRQLVRAFRGFKVLTLPYEQGRDKRKFSMHIFLPNAKDGLPALVERLGSERDFIGRHLPRVYVDVKRFLVPKFKMNFGFEASKLLKGRGLDLLFEGDGLTEMVGDDNLRVSNIFHKSFIEVNEEGTEAAAASAAMFEEEEAEDCSEKLKELHFVADHPFMFVVREDVPGVVIFTGQVTNPKEG